MIWLVLHHFLALYDELGVVFDDEALNSQVFSRYGLHPSLVVCLKFVG